MVMKDYQKEGVEYFKGQLGLNPEVDLSLAKGVLTKENYRELNREYQEFILSVSELFPVSIDDEELKDYASEVLDKRFKKGNRQFCSAARTKASYGRPRTDLQEDYRLGNADTCAERFLLDQLYTENLQLDSLVTYRGENVVNEGGVLHTLKDRGGEQKKQHKGVMRHLVGPCTYCREGLCDHDPASMVILPPAVPRPRKSTIKVPAFMLYPDMGLFTKHDLLEEKLKKIDSPQLLEARRRQKEFFKKITSRFVASEEDHEVYNLALKEMQLEQKTYDPAYVFCARTVGDELISEKGAEKPQPFSYLKYNRNDVQTRFVHKLHEQRHVPPSTERNPGSPHSLHVFVGLERDPKTDEVKTILPNADTRQKLAENFKFGFILMKTNGELVKVPWILLMPEPYQRLDKAGARDEERV